MEYSVDELLHMETIQVVLDEKLLKATDLAARQSKINRSALVREALRTYLRLIREKNLEKRDRAGYLAPVAKSGDISLWEGEAAWPAD